jgi:hypothetical protein
MYLTVPVIIFLFFQFGDNPVYFDRIYTISLLILSLFCINDKDSLSCIGILLIYWLASELLFDSQGWLAKVLVYTAAVWICYHFFRHTLAKFSLLFVLLTLSAEIYWYVTDYILSARLYYYVGMIAMTTLVIQVLSMRLQLMAEWFKHLSGRNALDYQVATILKAYLILHYLNLLEYFLRHLFGLKSILVIYEWFPVLSGLMSAMTMAVIFMIFFHYKAKSYLLA